MLEIGFRSSQHNLCATKLIEASNLMSVSLLHFCKTDDAASLSACISLAATDRKVLNRAMQLSLNKATQLENRDDAENQRYTMGEEMVWLPAVMACYHKVIKQLDELTLISNHMNGADKKYPALGIDMQPPKIVHSSAQYRLHQLGLILQASWGWVCLSLMREDAFFQHSWQRNPIDVPNSDHGMRGLVFAYTQVTL